MLRMGGGRVQWILLEASVCRSYVVIWRGIAVYRKRDQTVGRAVLSRAQSGRHIILELLYNRNSYRCRQTVDAGLGSAHGMLTCDDSIWVSLG